MVRMMLIGAATLLATGIAMATQLQVSDDIVTRSDRLQAVLQLPKPVEGTGHLKLTWTDTLGRTVAVEEREVTIKGATVPISLKLDRAVAMRNMLEAEITIGGEILRAPKAEFVVTPSDAKWDDYQIIMYNAYKTPDQQRALRDLGITAGKISGGDPLQPDGAKRWTEYDYRFYCDQIATAFYSAYHSPAYKPKQKMLLEAKAQYEKDRSNKEPLYRKPCFHDPAALHRATQRLANAVRNQKRFKPLFYAHCDEAGVADLVTAWDFCFDPRTLRAFRTWLVEQYGSLDAINAQWGTSFKTLDDVVPLTTDEMMAQGLDNLSQWVDHRHFMNKAFADVIQAGTDAVLAEDPTTYVGLVGCQMPSAFGGYDYWRLSNVMTCIEPYNIGNNREIWRSLSPNKPSTTTAFGFGDEEIWRLWYQMLHGDLGIIIYDEKHSYLDADAQPTEMAASIAPTYRELSGGIRKQLAYMERTEDPIAIHYSHPSVTTHWMFDAIGEGKAWLQRGSASERKGSEFLRLRESCVKVIEDNLFQFDFVAYGQLENGEFEKMDHKVMLLPQSIAMSPAECDALRRFVNQGGTLIADCRTALRDVHGKQLAKGQLDDLFGIERTDIKFEPGPKGLSAASDAATDWNLAASLPNVSAAEPGVRTIGQASASMTDAAGTPAIIVNHVGKGTAIYLNAVITDYHRWRLKAPEGEPLRKLVGAIIASAGLQPQISLASAAGDVQQASDEKQANYAVEVHPYNGGDMRILALHRNRQLRANELGPPEYQSQKQLESEMTVNIDLGSELAVYDQRAGKYLGKLRTVTAELPIWKPLILTVLPEPIEALTIDAPTTAKRGELVQAKLRLQGKTLGDTHALRVTVTAPDGKALAMLTQTLVAPNGTATWDIPIALSDVSGPYTLAVRDIATGIHAEHSLKVE